MGDIGMEVTLNLKTTLHKERERGKRCVGVEHTHTHVRLFVCVCDVGVFSSLTNLSDV